MLIPEDYIRELYRMMNTTGGFSDVQAGDLVAGLALLPAHTVIRGKVPVVTIRLSGVRSVQY